MAKKYTLKDVIVDPNDPRVKIGKEYYFAINPQKCVEIANTGDKKLIGVLREIKFGDYLPFRLYANNFNFWTCIIRNKEPKLKYVPFDFSKKSVRDKLRNKWIKCKNGNNEFNIFGFSYDEARRIWLANSFTAENLLEGYEFIDGTPFGEAVIEEEE